MSLRYSGGVEAHGHELQARERRSTRGWAYLIPRRRPILHGRIARRVFSCSAFSSSGLRVFRCLMSCSPDKNPGVKHAHERFSRLGVVSKILRDAEGRKRYVYFIILRETGYLMRKSSDTTSFTRTVFPYGAERGTTTRVSGRD